MPYSIRKIEIDYYGVNLMPNTVILKQCNIMSFSQIKFSDRYKLEQLLHKNSLKSIFRGRNVQTGELVIIKAEFFKAKNPNILYQGKFLQMTQGCPGIPWMHWCGPESEEQHLGWNLQELLTKCGGVFSIKTVILLGLQLLEMIEVYHFKELIHRRICPHSLQMGKGKKNHLLFFNDLLNSRKYIETKTGDHIQNRQTQGPQHGATIFSSFKTLSSQQASRRDDIESIILVLIYLAKGTLPWGGPEKFEDINQVSEHAAEILRVRKNLSNKDICEGMPMQFVKMLDHATQLDFAQQPNYSFLRKQLKNILRKRKQSEDYIFDWILRGGIKYQQVQHLNLQQSAVYSDVVPNQKAFLDGFYHPFESTIDTNEIETRFRSQKLGIKEQKPLKSEMKARLGSKIADKRKDDKCTLF